jgi:hypothetical protein
MRRSPAEAPRGRGRRWLRGGVIAEAVQAVAVPGVAGVAAAVVTVAGAVAAAAAADVGQAAADAGAAAAAVARPAAAGGATAVVAGAVQEAPPLELLEYLGGLERDADGWFGPEELAARRAPSGAVDGHAGARVVEAQGDADEG